ncbi:hypothetical protein THII_2050 [Thioploca ingrica]|uniref:CarD-like/TRCF RNAP-interacting domain-containing protein n=1 Tax=Thioploca ingrica TaxID=40754 RepID=A0A090AKY5_9GAMM|nr:hypothetical protein THII_2050 [Thioploca ingrica]
MQPEELISYFYSKAKDKGLTNQELPWSLAELQISEDDYQHLCEWVNQLENRTLDYWFRSYQSVQIDDIKFFRPAAIGFILLLLTSETVRREAKGKELWAVVRRKFSIPAESVLFASRQPSQSFKNLIEKTTREFNLRHVFGIEGLHNWFDSIYLQIGFTQSGFKTHLPEWLCRQGQPLAIQYLLGEKDKNLQSESFRKLWSTLRNFRYQHITKIKLRQELSQSPWILPNWIDELIQCATKKLELSDRTLQNPVTTSSNLVEELPQISFLTTPRLRWQPLNPPEFVCELQNLVELGEDEYDIFLGNHFADRLIRQEDGSYLHESELVLKQSQSAEVSAILKNAAGDVVESVLLQLWCHDEDLNLFDLQTGQRIQNLSKLSPNKSYALLVADDLTVEPEPNCWCQLADKKLYYLAKGWSQETQISQLAWQATVAPPKTQPPWTEQLQVVAHPVCIKLGEIITIQTPVSNDIEILFIRAGSKPMNLETRCLRITPDIFSFDFSQQMAKVKLKIGLQKSEEKAVINRELRLNVTGAIYLDSEDWKLLTPDTVLTCEQAKSCQFKVFAISSEENINRQDCGVFHGDTWIKRLWQKPQAIGDLAGLGENLTIHQGTYNRQDEGFILAKEVIDTGILTDPPEIHDGILSLKLSLRIEPDEQKHNVIWWDKCDELIFLEIDDYGEREEDFVWLSLLSEKCTEPLVIAVSYEGHRLGAWWNEQWTILLENSSEPERTASLIRWFKLPILSNRYLKNVQQFALTYPQVVLQQWLLAKKPIYEELQWNKVKSEQWFLMAMRVLQVDLVHLFQADVDLMTKLLTHCLQSQFNIGGLISHEEYGIGRYQGLITMEHGEFLHLEYVNQNKIYIPLTSLHLISPWTGIASELTSLDHCKKAKHKAAQLGDEIANDHRKDNSLVYLLKNKISSFDFTKILADEPFRDLLIMRILETIKGK